MPNNSGQLPSCSSEQLFQSQNIPNDGVMTASSSSSTSTYISSPGTATYAETTITSNDNDNDYQMPTEDNYFNQLQQLKKMIDKLSGMLNLLITKIDVNLDHEMKAHLKLEEIIEQLDVQNKKVKKVEKWMDIMDNNKRLLNLIIKGLPKYEELSDRSMVDRIAQYLKCDYRQITFVKRFGDTKEDMPILIGFRNFETRNEFYTSYLKIQHHLKLCDLGISSYTNRVFVNEFLTKNRQRIANTARNLRYGGKFIFNKVTTKKGVVYVETNGTDRFVPIYSMDEIDSIYHQFVMYEVYDPPKNQSQRYFEIDQFEL